MNKSIRKIIDQVSSLFQSILTGSKITRVDADGLQCSREGEVYDNLQTVHQYGFYSKPPKGSDALLLSNGDKRSQIIIGTKKAKYPELNEGESCLYSDKESLVEAPNIRLKGKKISIGEGENELVGLFLSLLKSLPSKPMVEGEFLVDPKKLLEITQKVEALKL